MADIIQQQGQGYSTIQNEDAALIHRGDVVVDFPTPTPSTSVGLNGGKKKALTTSNFVRLFYGYDFNRTYNGLDVNLEKAKAEDLVQMIDPRPYESENYLASWKLGISINNLIYRYTFQVIYLFLAFTLGIFVSIGLGLFTAMCEFGIAFICKPFIRLLRMFTDLFVMFSTMFAAIMKPVLELLLPWAKN